MQKKICALRFRDWRRRIAVVFCVFLAVASELKAESGRKPNPSVITVRQLVERFVEVSPALRSAKAEAEMAAETEGELFSGFFPKVHLVGSITEQQAPLIPGFSFRFNPNRYRAGVELTQPLYLGGRVWNAWRVAQTQKEVAKLQYLERKNQNLLSLIEVSLQGVSLQEQLAVLEKSRQQQKFFWDLVRKKKRKGIARDFEVSQAYADYLSYESRMTKLRQSLFEAKKQLLQQLEWPRVKEFKLIWPPSVRARLGLNSALELARQQRPDVLIVKKQKQLAEMQKKLDLGEHYPELSFYGALGYETSDRSQIGEENARTYSAILNLKIPIFSGLSSLNVRRRGEFGVTQAKSNVQRLMLQMRDQLVQGVKRSESVALRLAQAKAWEKEAQRALRLGLKAYRSGVVSSLRVVQLQVGYERAALNLTQVRYESHYAHLRWQLHVGADLEHYYSRTIYE